MQRPHTRTQRGPAEWPTPPGVAVRRPRRGPPTPRARCAVTADATNGRLACWAPAWGGRTAAAGGSQHARRWARRCRQLRGCRRVLALRMRSFTVLPSRKGGKWQQASAGKVRGAACAPLHMSAGPQRAAGQGASDAPKVIPQEIPRRAALLGQPARHAQLRFDVRWARRGSCDRSWCVSAVSLRKASRRTPGWAVSMRFHCRALGGGAGRGREATRLRGARSSGAGGPRKLVAAFGVRRA
jgi:hypothetical protein